VLRRADYRLTTVDLQSEVWNVGRPLTVSDGLSEVYSAVDIRAVRDGWLESNLGRLGLEGRGCRLQRREGCLGCLGLGLEGR
jgi:hypothetical protein